jgi:hypothetical protein
MLCQLIQNYYAITHTVFNNKGFKIYHQNICGLANKTNEIYTYLYANLPQILCFIEHRLKYLQINNLAIENYNLGTSFLGNPPVRVVLVYLYASH